MSPSDLIPPRMTLAHDPGFSMRYCQRNPSWVLFETEISEYGLCYEIDLFEDGLVSSSLQPDGQAEQIPTVEDLYKLAAGTSRLSAWLLDCATALAWSRALAELMFPETQSPADDATGVGTGHHQ